MTVWENEGVANVTIFSYISADSVNDLSLSFMTFNGNATESKWNIDYTCILFFSHSEPQPVAIKTITLYAGKDYDKLVKTSLQIVDFTTIAINIIDDDLAEGVETFYGQLNVRSSTQNFSVRITIEILDDEG